MLISAKLVVIFIQNYLPPMIFSFVKLGAGIFLFANLAGVLQLWIYTRINLPLLNFFFLKYFNRALQISISVIFNRELFPIFVKTHI